MTFCYRVLSASITATVFHDKDKSGTFNTGDTNLSGWRVFLDNGSPGNGTYDAGEPTGQTGTNGSYVFTVAPGASYRISEELLSSSWFASTPVCTAVGPVVANGSATASFGDFQKAVITASTYWDKAEAGPEQRNGRSPDGWTVFLDGNGNRALDAGEASWSTTARGRFSSRSTPGRTGSVRWFSPIGPTPIRLMLPCKSTGAILSPGRRRRRSATTRSRRSAAACSATTTRIGFSTGPTRPVDDGERVLGARSPSDRVAGNRRAARTPSPISTRASPTRCARASR